MPKAPKSKRVTVRETVEVEATVDVGVEVLGPPVWIYNDGHRLHRILYKDPKTRLRTDSAIPADGVALLAANVARATLWVEPLHPAMGKPRRINTHLSECTAAEAAEHCKRRGLPVPEEGS